MDTESIYNELIDVGDKQIEMAAIVEKNSRTLEELKSIVTTPVVEEKEPEEPVFQESIAISNLPDTQKVEVINPEVVDLSMVEALLKKLVDSELKPDDTDTLDAIKKLTSIIAQDKSISNVADILESILNKEYPQYQLPPELFDKDGRIRVEVDRTGGGGAGTLIDIEGERINPATSEKQANFSIPDFDEKIIDETDPDNTVITYKNGGVTVAVQTFAVVGAVTTITVV